ncbi:hypothetical protein [Chelativorans intermedius]|uniref:Uncharacterized protein n=1 Tax=Chelativorans intermedius TaxID=515947 RepID=A0ABV6DBI3_9HYPH|nr:hypothetical protein [Chelativorans intermedius]MCT8998057.1 hypothetical protein [Chelativorans intermedius]
MNAYATKAASLSLAAAAGLLALSFMTGAAQAEDKCKGQKWPDYSDDCIKQIVSEICKAGGGGSTCDEEQARGLVVTGKVRAEPIPATRIEQPRRLRQ